jgi:hypothetical protein
MVACLALAYLRLRARIKERLTQAALSPDAGVTTAEYIVWIGIAVAAAIAVGAIVTALLKSKASSLNLN